MTQSADHLLTVDADGHVLEPRDTWLTYIDPSYRDRAIRITNDDRGDEVLLIDGKPLEGLRNSLAALGGIELDPAVAINPKSRLTYEDGCPPGGYDPAARLKVMDAEEIDVALLYPTIGICWEGAVTDPGLANAYSRAYNRYITDFCSHDPTRLVPVAHISLLDPAFAVEETRRAREAGCKAIYLSPDLASRGGKHLMDPDFDPFWANAAELDMPVGFHVVVRDKPFFRPWMPGRDTGSGLFFFAFLAIDVMAAFTQMLAGGVFEKHPSLKCTVLESGATWIAAWLDRMDHKYEVMHDITPTSLKPSEYFYRQCLVSADPDETVIAPIVEAVGAEFFVWASDYPHIDASFGVVGEIRSRIASLPLDDQAKMLGLNAMRFYGLDTPSNQAS
ncbi:MAG: amidohydrolase [Acidimicrobiia bacterium]|nr:amidohydrolase [Acidimicrobiia bacterium]